MKTIIAIATAIVTLTGAYFALGQIQLRPVLLYEHMELAGNYWGDKAEQARIRLYDLESIRDDLKQKGRPIPDRLKRDIERTRSSIRFYEKKVK